jgi:type IV fimbrial biogenesis protein FimT
MHRQFGLSLVEVMVAIAVLGVLTALAAPSFYGYIENNRVRVAAETLSSGLNLARSEAIRRNRPVQFVLTAASDVGEANVNTINPSASGGSWVVRVGNDAGTFDYIDGRQLAESSGRTDGTSSVQVAGVDAGGTAVSQVIFSSMSRTNLGGEARFNFSNPTAGACVADTPPGPIRCQRVLVSPSGLVRICDPAAAAPDTRAC